MWRGFSAARSIAIRIRITIDCAACACRRIFLSPATARRCSLSNAAIALGTRGDRAFRGRGDCNDFSIGIELEGDDSVPFAAAQYDALIPLARALLARYPTIEAVVGHSQIAPERKTDPGPGFDWDCLFAAVGCALDARADSPPPPR